MREMEISTQKVGKFTAKYYITSAGYGSMVKFGVKIVLFYKDIIVEEKEISDITTKRLDIITLGMLLLKGKVTPTTLEDVVYDFIA